MTYLIRFLDLILGILIAEPRRELPVTKMPLRIVKGNEIREDLPGSADDGESKG